MNPSHTQQEVHEHIIQQFDGSDNEEEEGNTLTREFADPGLHNGIRNNNFMVTDDAGDDLFHHANDNNKYTSIAELVERGGHMLLIKRPSALLPHTRSTCSPIAAR